MKIPSKQQCFGLLFKMDSLEHIVAHSIQVCRVALLLQENLTHAGIELNRELIRASALLHDITKTRSLGTGEFHSQTGADLLAGMGYSEVGEIVRQHVRLDRYGNHDGVSEAAIINYADKRVLHDRIVSLETRMEYIFERYGQRPDLLGRLNQLWKKTLRLEEQIFAPLPFRPDTVESRIVPADCETEMRDYYRLTDHREESP